MDKNYGLVFMDFDGVLASARVHIAQDYGKTAYPMWSKFDPVTVDFFNRLHYNFYVKFVWNTTWMFGMTGEKSIHTEHWAEAMFRNAGFQGIINDPWRVDPKDERKYSGISEDYVKIYSRAYQTRDYLQEFEPEAWNSKRFICVDDNDYGYNGVLGVKRFVKTDSNNGMLLKHYDHMWSLASDIFEKKRKKNE